MTNDKHAHVHALAHELGNHETRHNLLGIGNGAWHNLLGIGNAVIN